MRLYCVIEICAIPIFLMKHEISSYALLLKLSMKSFIILCFCLPVSGLVLTLTIIPSFTFFVQIALHHYFRCITSYASILYSCFELSCTVDFCIHIYKILLSYKICSYVIPPVLCILQHGKMILWTSIRKPFVATLLCRMIWEKSRRNVESPLRCYHDIYWVLKLKIRIKDELIFF